jgi:hypothetical protein
MENKEKELKDEIENIIDRRVGSFADSGPYRFYLERASSEILEVVLRLSRKEAEEKLREIREEIAESKFNDSEPAYGFIFNQGISKALSIIDKHINTGVTGEKKGE